MMNIYIAGGGCGNIKGYFDNLSKLFLAGNNGKEKIIQQQKDAMELFLAGNNGNKDKATPYDPKNIGIKEMELYNASNFSSDRASYVEFSKNPLYLKELGIVLEPYNELNILESFYYMRTNTSFPALIPTFKNFLLDSGAFTFLSNSKVKVDWERYTHEYAEYINKYDIKNYFELDIDSIVGLKEVERLRDKLENLTHKKPIPVWHKNRGKEYFIQMCKEYPYVALGGIVSKEIQIDKYEMIFSWFIQTAHKYKRKIHGLGYTRIEGLHKFKFDSVDSTAWLYGNRGGYLYKFNPKNGTMGKVKGKDGKRFKSKETAIWNFNEWVKFQKYARYNL